MKKFRSLGIFASTLLFAEMVWAEVSAKDFSAQNSPHLPSMNVAQFEDGRDYFSYQEPIEQRERADRKIRVQFFFNYDCRVCSSAQDLLHLYAQMRPNHMALEEYPVATKGALFTAQVYYTLKALKAVELSNTLLFETSEKSRYEELASLDKIKAWAAEQGLDETEFELALNSAEVKDEVNEAVELTEEYGVFTYPYVVVGGKYVLTASTLYNDDYGIAVLDFLVNKLVKEQN